MAGQVKHVEHFFVKLRRIGAAEAAGISEGKEHRGLDRRRGRVLADEGIELVDSTLLLKPLLAVEGVLTERKPSTDEEADIDYGREDRSGTGRRGHWAERGDCGAGLRGGRSDGRNRRDAAPRPPRWRRKAAAAGEGYRAAGRICCSMCR